jgi:hypothetical protein
MAVDDSNNVRVDLQEIFDSVEKQTAYHSRVFNNNMDNQKIVITKDDYDLIYSWANEAAVLIADACNYITNTKQTGLEAISNEFSGPYYLLDVNGDYVLDVDGNRIVDNS